MPNITTCTVCGKGFEAGSEESANEAKRLCPKCIRESLFEGAVGKLFHGLEREMIIVNAVIELQLDNRGLQKENAIIEARLKVLEDRLGVNIHNPCSTG